METPVKIKTVKFYFKTRNEPKNAEIYRKKKLKIMNFFWKPKTDQKYAETDQKKETEQKTKKLLLKTGNGPKKWVNG